MNASRTSRIQRLVIVIGMTTLTAASFAVPKNYNLLQHIPAGDSHVVAGINPSQIVASPLITENWDAIFPHRAKARVEELQKKTGVDLLHDIETILLIGNPGQHTEGMILVKGRWEKERVLKALRDKSDFTEKKQGDHTYYTFYDSKDDLQNAVCFLQDDVALLSHEGTMIKTLGGGARAGNASTGASAQSSETAASVFQGAANDIPTGAAFWIAARKPNQLPEHLKNRPVLPHLKTFGAWGIITTTLELDASSVCVDSEKAKDVGQLLTGALALGRLHSENPDGDSHHPQLEALKPVLGKVQSKVDGDTVSAKVELTGEELKALIQAHRQMKGHEQGSGFGSRARRLFGKHFNNE